MTKRKLPSILILMAMALLGAMYWVDLCYYTDPLTGFVVRGTVWVRYAAAFLLPLAMGVVGLRTVGPRAIAVLRVRNTPLAVLFVFASVIGVAYGGTLVVLSVQPFNAYRLVLGLFFVWYGVWMFLAALQLFVQFAPSPTRSALWGILAALPFCSLTIYRVLANPTSLYRLGPLFRAFSALCVMLWMGMLLRALYIALTRPRARWMYLFGILSFLFATCFELPLAIYSVAFGGADAMILMEAILMASVGVVAGCVSVSLAGSSDAPQVSASPQPL